jgi:hypothetical protein
MRIDAGRSGRHASGSVVSLARSGDLWAQSLRRVRLRQVKHEYREHHRIVGTQQTFECYEERDSDEISRLNVQELLGDRSAQD